MGDGPEFGNQSYWEDRYQKLGDDDEGFDWHQDFESMRKILTGNGITAGKKVLILGCGNCKLMEDMHAAGFTNMECVDWSDTVIQKMKSKHSDKKGMNFLTMDVTSMADFKDNTYDAVIDKAVMDAMLCAENSTDKVIGMLAEVQRVLKAGGKFVSITHGKADSRQFYFTHPTKLQSWDIQVERLAKDAVSLHAVESKFFHTVFVCSK